MTAIHMVDESNFDEEVLKSSKPVLVDFYADWCGPCRSLAQTLQTLAQQMDGKIKICKVDVEKNLQLAVKYNVRSIPYLALIKNGQIAVDMVGNQPLKELVNIITPHL